MPQVLIPARNEEAEIGPLVRAVRNLALAVLVVDDGSEDRTAAVAEEAGAEVLRRPKSEGKGAALKAGIERLLGRKRTSAVILMDGDGQHKTADLELFLDAWRSEKHDLILGVRDSGKMPWARAVWNTAISLWLSLAAGRRLPDTQCGLRLLSRGALEKLRLIEAGYAVDSEIVLQASECGLTFSSVPVQTVASRKPTSWRSDVRRAFLLLGYAARAGGRLIWRRLVTPHKDAISMGIGLLLFAALLASTSHQALRVMKRRERAGEGYVAVEMEAALRWLKGHSKPDAIVMSHWFRGHQIVSFADRRVVATTKVYPSEADETAARYRDIARFFLTEDEDEAARIAARYGASYVFAEKSFQAWLCKIIHSCEYATSDTRTLNPLGLSRTVAGRMVQGGSFKRFQQVWDSSRFVIYEIAVREGLSTEGKRLALQAARQAVSSTLQGRPPGLGTPASAGAPVQVSLWNHGELRGSASAERGAFLESVAAAAVLAANDKRFHPLRREELAGLRIAIGLSKGDEAPLTADMIAAGKIDPLKGYKIHNGDRQAYFFPHMLLTSQSRDLRRLIEDLCAQAALEPECGKNAPLETFSAEAFIEGPGGRPQNLPGPVSGLPDLPFERLLAERSRLACEWLLRVQTPEGRILFTVDPLNGTSSPILHWVRNALAGESLVEAFRVFRDPRYLAAARRNAAYLERASQDLSARDPRFKPSGTSLAFSARENLALYQATREPSYLGKARRQIHELWLMRRPERPFPWGGEDSTYYALYGLTYFLTVESEEPILSEVLRIAALLKARFRSRRILKQASMSGTTQSYLINIFARLYELTGDRAHAEFALEVAQWVLEQQIAAGPPALEGTFWPRPGRGTPFVRGTGRVAEGLVDAYKLARCTGLDSTAERHRLSLIKAFRWMMGLQLAGPVESFIPDRSKALALGGFRHDLLDATLWNDAAGHFLIPAALYLGAAKAPDCRPIVKANADQ